MDEATVSDFMSNESHDKKEWLKNKEWIKRLNGGQLPDFWHGANFKAFYEGVRDSWDSNFRGEPGEEF